MTHSRMMTLTALLAFLPLMMIAHGVDISGINGGTGIQARYDSGEPVSDAEVIVYPPETEDTAFQIGATDRNGRFLFVPDSGGDWRIVLNDGTGHGGVRIISIDASGLPAETGPGESMGRWAKVLTGVSIIFGFTGFLFFLMARRERRRGDHAHS